MTLEEAINHCDEVAQREFGCAGDDKCIKCGKEHAQLAEWLRELRSYRLSKNTKSGLQSSLYGQ